MRIENAVAFERFQPVTGQCSQISKACGNLKPIKTHLGLPRKARELLDMSSGGKPLGGLVPIADNHGDRQLAGITVYVNSNSDKGNSGRYYFGFRSRLSLAQ
jgi:hypothetical protein